MRALAMGGPTKNLFSRTQSMLPALSREETGLALEWMMGSDIGEKIIQVAEEILADTLAPCRSLVDLFFRITSDESRLNKMTNNLMDWDKHRRPIPSFLHYVQTHSASAKEKKQRDVKEAAEVEAYADRAVKRHWGELRWSNYLPPSASMPCLTAVRTHHQHQPENE